MTYLSRNVVQATGATTLFSVPFPYLSKDHVTVSKDGDPVVFTWTTDNTVSISPAPSGLVVIRRDSSPAIRLVDFNDTSSITAGVLDLSALQVFYMAQEALDHQATPGVDGAMGATGATGAAGLAGTNGTNGTNGANGLPGADGAVGATGADSVVPGPAGADGATGATGADGAVGPAGADGLPGADGATGADGAVGPAGADGTNGVDGATGATGAPGSGTGGFSNFVKLTPGTAEWAVPTGVTRIRACVWGPGGGGGTNGGAGPHSGGGSGGYSEGFKTVTPGQLISCAIPIGGLGGTPDTDFTYPSNNGYAGSTASFVSQAGAPENFGIVANSGQGASQERPAAGGDASGGDINLPGRPSGVAYSYQSATGNYYGGTGGDAPNGGSGGVGGRGGTGQSAVAGLTPGGGGGSAGGTGNGNNGGNGGDAEIHIWY